MSYRIGANYRIPAVKAGDAVIVHARFSEPIADTPAMQITGTGVNPIAATNMTKFNTTIYTYRLTVGTGDGTQTFTLSQGTDLAGNVMASTSTAITVDNTAPATPTVNTLTSNDTTPQITGTIGTSTALSLSETFSVALDGTTYTPTVATDGTWSFTVSNANALTGGTYNVIATATDTAGNVSTDTTSNELTIDTTAPTATLTYYKSINGIAVVVTQVKQGDNMIVIATFNEDIAYTPHMQITGTGVDPIAVTSMTRFNAITYYYFWTVGTGDGTQTFTLSDGTDLAGNVMASTSAAITVDNTAPATPTVNTLTSNDTTPIITGTTGTGIALTTGETLSVALDGTSYTPTVATDGTWSFTVSNANALTSGTYEVVATFTDAAGNISTDTTSNELTIDTTAPTADVHSYLSINGISYGLTEFSKVKAGDVIIVNATFSEDIADTPAIQITGTGVDPTATTNMTRFNAITYYHRWTVGTGDGTQTFTLSQATDLAGNVITPTSTTITVDNTAPATPTVNTLTSNDTTPQITGTTGTGNALLTGETLSVALNGTTYTPTVATDGTWSFTANTPLADGTYNVIATATDAAGNVSTDTTSNELTVDTTVPTVELSYYKRINGISYGFTEAKVGDVIIVSAEFNEDIGDTPPIQITGTGVDPIAATNMTRDSNRTFHYFWTVGTGDGIQTFRLSQGTDLAGNVMASTATIITVDSTAPTADVRSYLSINGISYGLTEFSKVKAGDVIIINTEFNEDIADSPPMKITGTGVNFIATTDMIRYSNRTFRYSWTVGTGDGIQTFSLSNGTDLAGNVMEPASATITVDSTAPATPTVNTLTSNTSTPAVITGTTGTGNALLTGETLSVALNGTTYTPTVATDGTWSFTANTPLTGGIHNVIATITDAAGNVSTDTTTNELTIIDTTAPTVELSYYKRINGISYGITEANAGDVIIISAEFSEDMANSPPVQITGTGLEPIAATNMTRDSNRTFHYFWTASISDGRTQTFTLSQGEDLAGNAVVPVSTIIIVTADTTAPTVELSYYKRINGISYGITEANAGDVIIISAEFSEDMANTPPVQITGTGLEPIAATNMTRDSDRTFHYFWTAGIGDGRTQTFTLSQGEDLAGNAVVPVSTVIIVTVDTTAPTVELSYYKRINGISYGITEANAGDVIIISAEFSEDMANTPPVQITGTGLEPIAATNMTRDSNRTFHYFWTTGTGDGTQTFTLSQGEDLAGNVITPTSTTITVDTTAPATPTVNTLTSNDTTPEITGTIGASTALSLSETLSVALDGTSYTPTVATDGHGLLQPIHLLMAPITSLQQPQIQQAMSAQILHQTNLP